ncbi:hypothetical protein BO71DRAFT_133896 [Aspergillus ellipticus CBS 707.79]|uniref:Uncharacterized protein n=1 Tax=Aspergillus ellipticus CBS 707.79 TaxID=1448320 RepID=A0A319DKN0_9EURO|nr:hypothetical protein BO71DRAFT_133896 [Aspergillus ellipticus CBS 707.79]
MYVCTSSTYLVNRCFFNNPRSRRFLLGSSPSNPDNLFLRSCSNLERELLYWSTSHRPILQFKKKKEKEKRKSFHLFVPKSDFVVYFFLSLRPLPSGGLASDYSSEYLRRYLNIGWYVQPVGRMDGSPSKLMINIWTKINPRPKLVIPCMRENHSFILPPNAMVGAELPLSLLPPFPFFLPSFLS